MNAVALSDAEQARADSEEIVRHVMEGRRVTDPDLLRRVRERAEVIEAEIRSRFGVVEWAVDLIREGRDED